MNNPKKTIGIFLFILFDIILFSSLLLYFLPNSRIQTKYDVTVPNVPSFNSVADLNEGQRLFLSRGCADCHSQNGSGKVFIEDPLLGTYSGSNLTSGLGGIGTERSAGELALAIRGGVGKNGRALIFMPSTDFHGMSDSDVGKLVSYIKTFPPVNNTLPKITVGPLARLLFLLGELPALVSAEQIDHSLEAISNVNPTVSIEYGRYVASTCTGCHGMDLKGGPIQGAPPEWPPAQNIAGVALVKWSEADFIKSIRTGVRPDGSKIAFPMPWQSLKHLTDIELKAIRMYLLSL